MKHEAITRRELPRLIRQIRETGSFHGTRGGHIVEITLQQSLLNNPISYGVCVKRHWSHGQADTVAAAVDAINSITRRNPVV